MILKKKMKKLITNFEPINDEDVINKTYLDEIFLKKDGHLSLLGRDYNEFKKLSHKQSIEEVLIQRVVKTNNQVLFDKGLFDSFSMQLRFRKIFCLLQDVDLIYRK